MNSVLKCAQSPRWAAQLRRDVLCFRLKLLVALIGGSFVLVNLVVGFLVITGANRGFIASTQAAISRKCHGNKASLQSQKWTRHIHQIWNDKNIPAKFQSAVQHCRDINPGYKYSVWTPEERRELLEQHYSWLLDTYDSYDIEMSRINVAKYLILYEYGGMYLDIDMECKVSFDSILRNMSSDVGVVMGATVPNGVGTAWVISKQHHPYMEFALRRLPSENRWYALPYYTNTISSGVIYMWRTYLNYPCPDQVHLVDPDTQYNVYFNHLHLSSWHGWDAVFVIFLDTLYKKILRYHWGKVTILLIVALFLHRKLRSKQGNGKHWTSTNGSVTVEKMSSNGVANGHV